MDPARFTTAQRLSCKMMNPDLFKPSQAVQPPAKPNRSKSEHVKTEVAQVVVDAKSGRSYCKGKLLGKVPLFYIYSIHQSFWINYAICYCLVPRFLICCSNVVARCAMCQSLACSAGFGSCSWVHQNHWTATRPVCDSRTYLLVIRQCCLPNLIKYIWFYAKTLFAIIELTGFLIRFQTWSDVRERWMTEWINASMKRMLHCLWSVEPMTTVSFHLMFPKQGS